MLRSIAVIFYVIGVSGSVSAETFRVADMIVEAPWARASIGTSRPAAAYLVVRNIGRSSDVLTGVEASIAAMAAVHKVEVKKNIAEMGPAGPIAIPAGGSVALEPGAMHIMLMRLQRALKKGERFTMTLIFEKAGRVEISVPIQGIRAKGPPE
ncbi:MAG: copper chaperone PCu(A)C [Cognatishimia sp.]|uniref:copper chaperone PCu(A)C n=1 Tax=Cognatishimia sp. TaxID=2211648 RepID=UPI0040587D4B